jgi:antitoxin (DNA-binding transcriptional repressor) of toxin-antitoxin stability system
VDLVAHNPRNKKRKPGSLAGQIEIAPDFDETPDEVISRFEDL